MKFDEAKSALDKLINKSRVHFYKPIQIAEILYHDRVYRDIDLSSLDTYRTQSKKWRDEVSLALVGRICTSSSRFQDNLFDDNAIPVKVLEALGKYNRKTDGAVEAYIYHNFINRHSQLKQALEYCKIKSAQNFNVKKFIDSFRYEPGLKRSLDKIYEIIVYALFSALAEALNLQVKISVDDSKSDILIEFKDFAEKVMRLNPSRLSQSERAKIYRAGVTNAADRGIDIYSSWGAVIQVKHLSLDEELAEEITANMSSDRIIIVCKDADKNIILSLLSQIGWRSHIQSIITEQDLILWYEKALRGKFAYFVSDKIMSFLREEIANEFPSADNIPNILSARHYEKFNDKEFN